MLDEVFIPMISPHTFEDERKREYAEQIRRQITVADLPKFEVLFWEGWEMKRKRSGGKAEKEVYDILNEALTIRKTAKSVKESIMSEHIVYNVSLNDAPNWVRTLRQSLLAGVTEMDLKHVEEMMRKKWEKEKANMKKDFRKFAPTEPPTIFKEEVFFR